VRPFFVALAAIAVSACRSRPTTAPVEQVAAEVSGCDAIARVDGILRCEVFGEQTLRVVAPLPSGARITIDGRPIVAQVDPIDGASRFVVTTGKGRLSLEADRPPRRATIDLVAADKPTWLRDANAARKAGRYDDALAIVAPHATAPSIEGARARGVQARVALARGRPADASAILAETHALFRGAGRLSEEIEDRTALAFVEATIRLDIAAARRALAGAEESALAPDLRALLAYFRARTEVAAGDLRQAFELLGRSRGEAERFAFASHLIDVEEFSANLHLRTGRAETARIALAALSKREPPPSPCRRVDQLVNLAIATRASPSAGIAAARAILDDATKHARDECRSGPRLANALFESAASAFEEGDLEETRTALRASRDATNEPGPWLSAAWEELEGRLALATGRSKEALVAFDRAVALAGTDLELGWAATTGRAEALAALGRSALALEAFRTAERLLDRAVVLTPIAEGRGALADTRERSLRGLVDLLVTGGRPREAFEALRVARGRLLRALIVGPRIEGLSKDERERWELRVAEYRRARAAIDAEAAADWTLPAAELARVVEARRAREARLQASIESVATFVEEPARLGELAVPPGTVVLAWAPAREGAHLFVATPRDVRARKILPSDDPARVVDAAIAGAVRVRVLSAPATSPDVHALPFAGEPLLSRAAFEYTLDLPPAPGRPAARPSTAIVVADPDGDLPSARVEAARIEERLGKLGFGVELLRNAGATAAAIQRGLSAATLFHYAGHAFVDENVWGSALSLADGGRFTLADLIARRDLPRIVVLAACDAAKFGPATGKVQGFGIAHGFVAAGSDVVIAPVRPVRDHDAAALAEALYGDPDFVLDPVSALARAQLALRSRSESADWAAFRAIVR
jgi:tetratricopeptide (TPR) repeat protein